MSERGLPQLKVGTGWIEVEVLGGPDVQLTFKGYVPWLHVKVPLTGLEYRLLIGAKTLAEPLERMRNANAGRFVGLKFRLRKASMEQMAPYEFEPLAC